MDDTYTAAEFEGFMNDVCYECTGYGDDYYLDENGELVSACNDCWVTRMKSDE